jgi:Amino acid permease
MWWSYLGNAVMGTIMLITMLFCIGDLDNAIDSDAPFLVLFTNTGSTPVALMLSVVLFLLIFAGNITTLAATSRELWAFSRDRGFPFSRWISKVSSNGISRRFIHLACVMLTTNDPALDEPQMEHPLQLGLPCLLHRRPFLPDQSRFQFRFRSRRLPYASCSALYLYALDRLRAAQTDLGRGTTSSTVESRKTRPSYQRICLLLLHVCHCLFMLPQRGASGAGHGKLGTCGLGGCDSDCAGGLFIARSQTLYTPSYLCGRTESCWSWIAIN